MERYHIYKLGIAILFYAIYCDRKTVVNGLKVDDVTKTIINRTDSREARDVKDGLFFYQGADGTPGIDFPILSYVPRTKFTCKDMEAGYYADVETHCQVFHICDEGRKLSFLCPNGTIFQQGELICDWWYKVNCTTAPLLYEESAEILQKETAKRKDARRYQGTKHGVFSDKNDYGYEHTPSQFVTPSYPYKSQAKVEDNRISETPNRRNYNNRGDRKLESVGNGVREGGSRTQNNFASNLQGKKDHESSNRYYQSTTDRSIYGNEVNGRRNGGQTSFSSSSTSFQKSTDSSSQTSFNRQTQNNRDSFTNGAHAQNGGSFRNNNQQSNSNGNFQRTSQQRGQSTTYNQQQQFQYDRSSHTTTSPHEQTKYDYNTFGRTPDSRILQKDKTPQRTTEDGNYSSFSKSNADDSFIITSSPKAQDQYVRFSIKTEGTTKRSTTERFFSKTSVGSGQNRFDTNVEGKTDEIVQSTPKYTKVSEGDFGERIPVSVISAETQVPQETASFVKNSRNNLQNAFKHVTNPYPNHQQTYSEIKDPRHYYEESQSKLPEKPFYGSSISPNVLSTIPVTTRGGSFRSTTEFSVEGKYKAGLATTLRPNEDDRYGATKLYSSKSSATTSRFGFGTKSEGSTSTSSFGAHLGDAKVKGTTRGVEISNLVSTTLIPDDKSTATYGLQSNSGFQTSTPSVGISNRGYGGLRTTEYRSTDSPIIKVNIIPSTVSPGFQSSARSGKSFKDESPKTQVIRIQDTKSSPTKSKVNVSNRFSVVSATTPTSFASETLRPNLLSTVAYVAGKSTIVEGINSYLRGSQVSRNKVTTAATPTGIETAKYSINDQLYATPESTKENTTFTVNVNEQKYSTPASTYSISRNNALDTTSTKSFSSILQPKPFSSPTQKPFTTFNFVTQSSQSNVAESKSGISESDINLSQSSAPPLPPYKVSSASPFTTTTSPSQTTLAPTVPTPFTTESNYLSGDKTVDENVNNVVNTLMEIVKQRLGTGNDIDARFSTPRPGLVVPPSAGPQTLHSLAIYFAHALDNLTSSSPKEIDHVTDAYGETDSPIIHIRDEELIKNLLTQMTVNNYDDLFSGKQLTTTTEPTLSSRAGTVDDENDLAREDTKHAGTEGPPVRQLARVFTEALSAYLDDPDTFRKVLKEVRPTEPPLPTTGDESNTTEEDEVLNYSDSDLKSDRPHLPTRQTPIPVSPTWGYILAYNKSGQTYTTAAPVGPTWGYVLAFNKSESHNNNLESRNSLNPENENLQSADSQSFVSQFNRVTQELKESTKSLKGAEYAGTTAASYLEDEQEDEDKTLPQNHWTTSSDVAKLFQTTLSINPAVLNEGIEETQNINPSESSETTSSEEDSTRPTGVSEIQYELRALPKLELNSTQVHGILIDFMNETKSEGAAKLHRLLDRLNITEEEFLNKMKEIEANPLTRRLILLLISECNTEKSKEIETRATSSDNIFNSPESKSKKSVEKFHEHTENLKSNAESTQTNAFKQIVHPSLNDDDEDTRALQLLNSLYVIASKFGK